MEWIHKNRILWEKIGIIIGVYLGMKYLVPLVIPFFVAAILVYWLQPLLRKAREKLHLKPALVMGGILLLFAALAAGGLYWAGRTAGARILDFFSGVWYSGQGEAFLYECCDSLGELLRIETEDLRIFVTEQILVFQDQAQQQILPGAVGGSWQAMKKVGTVGAAVLVTGISVLLLASDYDRIRELGRKSPFYERSAEIFRGILRSVGGYLKAQGIIMGIVMVICIVGIWLAGWISGRPGNPVWAGVGTGFLDALPVFGTGTVFLPWMLLKLLQREFAAAGILAATYALCVLTRELLEPKLVGEHMGILPIVILGSVYVGVKVYGLGGIFLGPLSVLLVQELWKQADKGEIC